MRSRPVIALTPGEPAGVGPDLAVSLGTYPDADLVLIADRALLADRAVGLGQNFAAIPWNGVSQSDPGIYVLPMALAAPTTPGVLDRNNSDYVLACLRRAIQGCQDGEFGALVTGPVHKGIINDAGFAFTGHTEFLAAETGAPAVVMMLAAPGLRVALVTTHLALADVPAAITEDRLETAIQILHSDLSRRFGISDPVIAICGLNPHAGESGHLGREEIEVIEPVIRRLTRRGLRLLGPVAADTAFLPANLAGVDAVLAMYHDQGLPVLKHSDFAHAINITLGLPFVRTSVDHGTALELAGTGRADTTSLREAIGTAVRLATKSES